MNMQIHLLSVFVMAWSTYSPFHKPLLSSLPHELEACVRRHSIDDSMTPKSLMSQDAGVEDSHNSLLDSTRPPQTQVPPEKGTQAPCKVLSPG